MNTRRNFLVKGSLATTALIAAKPFSALARTSSTFASLTARKDQLVLIHTAAINGANQHKTAQFISSIKEAGSNALLVHADKKMPDAALGHEIVAGATENFSGGDIGYRIVYKGGIKTGVINIAPNSMNAISRVNELAAELKKQKNCQVVVCLSPLGYKNTVGADDITLAAKSTHLDVIISGHASNFPAGPVIKFNSKRHEVILHSAAGSDYACSKIEISFDENGQKRQIGFAHKPVKQSSLG